MDKLKKIVCALSLCLISLSSLSAQTPNSGATEQQKGITLKIRGQFQSTQPSRSKRKKELLEMGEKKALEDAQQKGIQYMLYHASPPLLITPDERSRFEAIKKEITPQLNTCITSSNIEARTLLGAIDALMITANIQFNSTQLNALLEEKNVLDSDALRHPKPDRSYSFVLKIKENEFKKEELDIVKALGLKTIKSLSKEITEIAETNSIQITVNGNIYTDNSLIWDDIQRRFLHNQMGAKLKIVTGNAEPITLEIIR